MKKFDAEAYEKRKNECLESCFRAFMDNGLENTGLQTLCRYCGFKTNQALYHYFGSKNEIISESVKHAMINFEREFMKMAPRSREELKDNFERFPHWVQSRYGEHIRFVYQVYTSPKFKNEGYEFFAGITDRYDRFIRHVAKNLMLSFESIRSPYYLYVTSMLHFVLFNDKTLLNVELGSIYKLILEALKNEPPQ